MNLHTISAARLGFAVETAAGTTTLGLGWKIQVVSCASVCAPARMKRRCDRRNEVNAWASEMMGPAEQERSRCGEVAFKS